ncbi:hypothetical protein TSOC_015307, partial [Tetrabaena socialis]
MHKHSLARGRGPAGRRVQSSGDGWGEGGEHYCPAGPHVVHLFSMSKAYGMMGWRIGYIAYPDGAGAGSNGAGAAPAVAGFGVAPGALGAAQLK